MFKAFNAGHFRSIGIRIKFQGHIALVVEVFHCPENLSQIDGTVTGYQVLMDPASSNVFEMNVPNPFKKGFKGVGRIFTGTKKVSDIEIDPHGRGPDLFDKRLEFGGPFDHQIRFRFHQQANTERFGLRDDLLESFEKQGHGLGDANCRLMGLPVGWKYSRSLMF